MKRTAASSPDVEPAKASPLDTRRFYLHRSKRKIAPVRRTFIQGPRTDPNRVRPLASFVRNGDQRGLNAYLYLLAITSSDLDDVGWTYTLDSRIWARAFGTTEYASDGSALTAVVRILDRLAERRLITWKRTTPRSPEIAVTLLKEDGSGDPYTRPGRDNKDPFINLPFGYWYDEWDQKLSVPAIAMLLALSAEFRAAALPTNRMSDWYGWSPDTAERGFDELEREGLLNRQKTSRKAPNSPLGWTVENRYTLERPFRHRKRTRSIPKVSEEAAAAKVPPQTLPDIATFLQSLPRAGSVPTPAGGGSTPKP